MQAGSLFRFGIFSICALAVTPGDALATPDLCPPRVGPGRVLVAARVVLTTNSMSKNVAGQCGLLDAFQIASDGKNLGANSCGNIDITNVPGALEIDAGSKTFVFYDEIFVGNKPVWLHDAHLWGDYKKRAFRVTTGSHLHLTDSDLQRFADYNGGAILVESGAGLSTYRVYMTNNRAQNDGGAIAFDGSGKLRLLDTVLKDNEAATRGGALAIHAEFADIRQSRILGNIANAGGGGIYVHSLTDIDIANSYIEGNQVSQAGDGGGIHAGAQMTVTCTAIRKNSTYNGDGGGIYVEPASGLAIIDGASIDGNTAGVDGSAGRGGGVFVGEDFHAKHSSISENQSTGDGGGIYIADAAADDSIRIENTTIAKNESTSRGGGLWITGKNATVIPDDQSPFGAEHAFRIFNSTISSNRALDAQITVNQDNVSAIGEILFLNNIVTHDGGLAGCAGNPLRFLTLRINDPDLEHHVNVQWPEDSCGADIPTVYGSGAPSNGWLFKQQYAMTIIPDKGDPVACAYLDQLDQFNHSAKCVLGAARSAPPAVMDPYAFE